MGVHVTVQTAAAVEQQVMEHKITSNSITNRNGQDVIVAQCVDKLNQVESSIFERDSTWRAKLQELEPITEQINELREIKSRSMSQLNDFIEACTEKRLGRLKAGFREVIPIL